MTQVVTGIFRSPQKTLYPTGPWTCSACGEKKELSEFYISAEGKKQDYRCKVCRRAERNTRWATNHNGCRDKQKTASNTDARRAVVRASHLRRQFNITIEQYEDMLESQNGVCAICSQPETKRHPTSGDTQRLAVDHDHTCCSGEKSCGKCVRGLLCARCNQTLGHLEKARLLDGILAYVQDKI